MTTAPNPREAADRVEKWLEQWRPDRHQTYSLASADLRALIDHARATDPAAGGDLAALRVWVGDEITEARRCAGRCSRPEDARPWDARAAAFEWVRVRLDRIATPAAPAPEAATEGGERQDTGLRIAEEEVSRYGFTRCMVAALYADTYAGPWQVEDREDGAWDEVDELLAIRDRLDARALARALGMNPEEHDDLDEAIAGRIATLAATPRAEGEAAAGERDVLAAALAPVLRTIREAQADQGGAFAFDVADDGPGDEWVGMNLAALAGRLADVALRAHRCAPPAPEVVSGAEAAALPVGAELVDLTEARRKLSEVGQLLDELAAARLTKREF